MTLIAPKAQKLYEEFVSNYEKENPDKLRTWAELSEGEQIEWTEFAGEQHHVMGNAMYPPPIPQLRPGQKGNKTQ